MMESIHFIVNDIQYEMIIHKDEGPAILEQHVMPNVQDNDTQHPFTSIR